MPWALVALGAGYTGSLLLGADRLDAFAPVYAACLIAVGGLVLASGELSPGGGMLLETAGMAAAVGAMALVAFLAGRRRG